MTTFVLGTGSVHASAALCDYLDGRLGGGDAVHAAAWTRESGGRAERDAEDALNGVRSRLGVHATVETRRLDEAEGAAADLGALADRTGADELVVAVGSGAGGLAPDGVADLVAGAARPVVAVPLD